MGSSGAPFGGIWKKWSITHRLYRPPSSAARATLSRLGRTAAEPPGQSKRLMVNPMRTLDSKKEGVGDSAVYRRVGVCWAAGAQRWVAGRWQVVGGGGCDGLS